MVNQIKIGIIRYLTAILLHGHFACNSCRAFEMGFPRLSGFIYSKIWNLFINSSLVITKNITNQVIQKTKTAGVGRGSSCNKKFGIAISMNLQSLKSYCTVKAYSSSEINSSKGEGVRPEILQESRKCILLPYWGVCEELNSGLQLMMVLGLCTHQI